VPRWEKFFARLGENWGATLDAAAFEQEIRAWEDEWTHSTGLPPTPAGDTIEVVRSLYEKYT